MLKRALSLHPNDSTHTRCHHFITISKISWEKVSRDIHPFPLGSRKSNWNFSRHNVFGPRKRDRNGKDLILFKPIKFTFRERRERLKLLKDHILSIAKATCACSAEGAQHRVAPNSKHPGANASLNLRTHNGQEVVPSCRAKISKACLKVIIHGI